MLAFCSPCPYAALCPVAVARGDDELIPELSSPAVLMTDGRRSRHGSTVITVIVAHAPQAPCCNPGPGVPFSLRAAAVRPGRATADFSKRTIVAGPHVWLVGGPAIDESSVGIRSPDRALRRNRRWRWLGPMLPPGIRPRRPGPPCMRLRRPILKANRTAPAGQRGCSGASTRPIQQLDSQRMSCGLRAWNQDYAALRLLYQRKAVASDSEWPMRDRKATRRRLPTRTGSCR